jgi:hypothetical protein
VYAPGTRATPIWRTGRDNSDAAGPPPEGRRLDGKQLDRMVELTRETEERGLEPIEVATVIEKAIRKRYPRARYIIGRDAKMMARMQSLAGDKNFDKIMRRAAKLPNHAPPAK